MLSLTTSGVAVAQTEEDPLEGYNRTVFAFNEVVDGAFIRPAALVYRAVTPQPVRNGVSNVFFNLSEPVNFLNAALQGNGERFGQSFSRFMINTTLGLGGIMDIAAATGRPPIREDFGQTLHVWGWENSSYFVIPFLGPSTVRDATGLIVDFATVPWGFFAPAVVTLPAAAGRIIDAREAVLDPLDELKRSSLDYYASLRTVFVQRREFEIFNGQPPSDNMFDDIEVPVGTQPSSIGFN